MLAQRIFAYCTIYLVWGSTYLAIRFGVRDIPAFYLVGIRFSLGGLLLLLIAWRKGDLMKRPPVGQIVASVFIGLFLLIGGNGFVTLAEKRVDSYLAALIVASTPLFVAFTDRIILGKKVHPMTLPGALLGLCGVGLLLYDPHRGFPHLTADIGLIALAVLFWAVGTTLSKRLSIPEKPLVNSGIQLTIIGFLCLIVLQFIMPAASVDWNAVSVLSWGAAAYLAVPGSLALWAYAWLLKHEPNDRIVTYAIINPLIAVILGIFVGSETAVSFLFPGTTLILAGVALTFYGHRFVHSRVKSSGGR